MNFLTKFSNSWGHLIMSMVLIATGLTLILSTTTDGTMKGVGVSLIMTSSGYWFVSSAASHMNGGNTNNVPTQNSSPNP